METKHIPSGNQAVMPYLMLHNAQIFLNFTKEVFGATQNGEIHKRPDTEGIMHAEVMIDGSTIMCCDAREQWIPTPANLFVYVNDADETYKKAMAAGASSVMELSNQDYGRTCGVTDPCGNVWWITSVLGKN